MTQSSLPHVGFATLIELWLFLLIAPFSLSLISFVDPNISVQLKDDGTQPKPGFSYSLTCNVIFSGGVDFNFTYAWMKENIILSETGSSLSFSSLRLSDAGAYTCKVTANLQHRFISRSNIQTITLKRTVPLSCTCS